MAQFDYLAKTENGATQRGVISASDQASAVAVLGSRKLVPVYVKASKKGGKLHLGASLSGKVKAKHLAVFTRQLSTMVSAGVPLVRGLDTLSEQTESQKLRDVLQNVIRELKGGKSLSECMKQYPKVFNSVFISMIQAGEAGGILEEILEKLATQIEKDNSIKRKVKGAMIYPVVILSVTFIAFMFITIFIIPRLADIFAQFDSELPIYTKIVVGLSAFMQKRWYLMILGFVAFIIGFRYLRKKEKPKYIMDAVSLKLPIFGKIILQVNLARFARTFSSLISAGVSVLDSLSVTQNSLNNSLLRSKLAEASELVRNGQPVSESLTEVGAMPPMISQMAAVGEETGKMDVVLTKLAEYYEEEVDNVMSNFISIIEPVLIVFLAVVVGGVVISVFAPITQLINVVK